MLKEALKSAARIIGLVVVLLLHGTSDSIIPYSQGEALFKLANDPKRFVSVEGGEHNTLVDDMGFDNYYELIKGFVDGAGASENSTRSTCSTWLKTREQQ